MTLTEEQLKEARTIWAKSGGDAILKKRGRKYFKKLSKKGVLARKNKAK